jgi:S1-C subfamily serine protease
VAFCINCGAHNPEDGVFCLSCGQPLYRPHEKLVSRKAVDWKRARVPVLILLVVLLGVFAAVVSIGKFGNSHENSAKATDEHSQKAIQFDESVLMIVGVNDRGSPVSQGSGFIVTSDGLAGSNYHVLRGVTQAFVECCNGRKFKIASIEGADLEKDLVVFQLYEVGSSEKPQNLPHVAVATSKDLKVGQKVIAIGSPQGLENTVSDGILSAIREYDSVRYLQITAPISPGSSGGPVLNSDGQMIGVATFQFERGQNLNFAIAADYIQPLLDQHFQVSMKEFQTIVRRSQRQQRGAATSTMGDTPQPDQRPDESPLTGQFGGIVHNQTADISAEFGVVVLDREGILTGCMGVQQPLFGSGPLEGVLFNSDVTFIVTSAIGKITFQGKRKKAAITGTYTVEHPDGTEESGGFTLQRTSSKGPDSGFNPSTCPTDAELHN